MLYIAVLLLIMPKMCIFVLISANIFIVKGILMYSIIFPYCYHGTKDVFIYACSIFLVHILSKASLMLNNVLLGYKW